MLEKEKDEQILMGSESLVSGKHLFQAIDYV